jgi:hypothetical protein
VGRKDKQLQFRRLGRAAAVQVRARLRSGRNQALADSEGYLGLLQEIEELGAFLAQNPKATGLHHYSPALLDLAQESPLRGADFPLLLDALRQARNDAAHLGAAARRTTGQAVAVSIVLEDAMARRAELKLVEHFMVDAPTCAEPWQTISMIRRMMLQHQYSVLPYRHSKGWRVVTDDAVVHFLSDNRDERLTLALDEAEAAGLKLKSVATARMGTTIDEVYDPAVAPTLLVIDDENNLRGILTPFDML